MSTGSGITLLCGFMMVQARAARKKRRQEHQASVAFGTTPDLLGNLNCQKQPAIKPGTFSDLWKNIGVITKAFQRQCDVKARPEFMFLTGSRLTSVKAIRQ